MAATTGADKLLVTLRSSSTAGYPSIAVDDAAIALERAAVPWHHLRLLEQGSLTHLLAADGARAKERRVAFWSDQMCERGTEVALYDYADSAERCLGVSAFVLYDSTAHNNYDGAAAKFRERFGERVYGVEGWEAADSALSQLDIECVYAIKCNNDRKVSKLPGVRTFIHCVFDAGDAYGDVYAKISPCVPGATVPVVPHIVRPALADGPDMRRELGIPADAIVFGRYGGYESFDVECAREALLRVARATSDADTKSRFIRTCDAMLHARSSGETFGLSVGEFSAHNRRVITSRDHTDGGIASFHLDTLKAQGSYYSSTEELVNILTTFDRTASAKAANNAYRPFEPANVMQTFAKVFLNGKPRKELPDWKSWRRTGKRTEASSGRRLCSRPEAQAEFERRLAKHDALGRLRGLPAEEEVPFTTTDGGGSTRSYRVFASAPLDVRLSPSTSAASVQTLSPGAKVEAYAMRGAWVRVAPAEAGPRWVLTRHPEDGELLRRD